MSCICSFCKVDVKSHLELYRIKVQILISNHLPSPVIVSLKGNNKIDLSNIRFVIFFNLMYIEILKFILLLMTTDLENIGQGDKVVEISGEKGTPRMLVS